MKTKLLVTLTILLLILLRGSIYRVLITYHDIGEREGVVLTNQNLIEKIKSQSGKEEMDLKKIVAIADNLTKQELKFTTKQASNNPNVLAKTHAANCIGYSALFNAIAIYLIQQHELDNEIEAQHKIGQLYLLGINLHSFFNHSFFKDHDFNLVRNKKSGEVIFIDPSISDYLFIKRISVETR